MKILHSIALLMLPIVIVNNNSYTMDDDKYNNGDTPEYLDENVIYIDGNSKCTGNKDTTNQNELITHLQKEQNDLLQEYSNKLKSFENNLQIYKSKENNPSTKETIENLLLKNSVLNSLNHKLDKTMNLWNKELFTKYALIDSKHSITIGGKQMKLFIVNQSNTIQFTHTIHQVLNNNNDIDVIIKNKKIFFPDENKLLKNFKELQKEHPNGYYSILQYEYQKTNNGEYYLAYIVPENEYFNNIYVKKDYYELKKIQCPFEEQYKCLERVCNVEIPYQYETGEPKLILYTLPKNTNVYVHNYLFNPESELVNINDLKHNDQYQYGILRHFNNYYLFMYYFNENNDINIYHMNGNHFKTIDICHLIPEQIDLLLSKCKRDENIEYNENTIEECRKVFYDILFSNELLLLFKQYQQEEEKEYEYSEGRKKYSKQANGYLTKSGEYSEKAKEYSEKANKCSEGADKYSEEEENKYLKEADEYSEKANGYLKQAKECSEKANEYLEQEKEYLEKASKYSEKINEYFKEISYEFLSKYFFDIQKIINIYNAINELKNFNEDNKNKILEEDNKKDEILHNEKNKNEIKNLHKEYEHYDGDEQYKTFNKKEYEENIYEQQNENEIIINTKIQNKQQQNINNNEQILKTKEQLNENISILFEMINEHQKSKKNKELINNPIKDEEQLKQIILNEDFIDIITNNKDSYDYLSKNNYGFLGNAEFMYVIKTIIDQYNKIQNTNNAELNKNNNENNNNKVMYANDKNEIIINNYKYNNEHIEENKNEIIENQNLQLRKQNEVIELENQPQEIKNTIKNKEQEIVNQYNVIKQKWNNTKEEQKKFSKYFSNLITSTKFLQTIKLNDQKNNVNKSIDKYFKDKKYKIPEEYYQGICNIAKLNDKISELKNNINASKDDNKEEINKLKGKLVNDYSKLIQNLSSDKNHIKHPDYLYQLITSRKLSDKLIHIISQDKQNNNELNNILFEYFKENNYLVPQEYYKQIYEIAKLNMIVQNLKIEAENIKNKLKQK